MGNENVEISVVIPVYGCEEALMELYARLKIAIEAITDDFEIIMVNDACPRGSWEVIVEIHEMDPRVKGVDLSRNFGQHRAITAGLDESRGEWDCCNGLRSPGQTGGDSTASP